MKLLSVDHLVLSTVIYYSACSIAVFNRCCVYVLMPVVTLLDGLKILLVHGQVTIVFIVSVGLSVCLFVCAEFFSAVFDPIWIKLGHMLYVWV